MGSPHAAGHRPFHRVAALLALALTACAPSAPAPLRGAPAGEVPRVFFAVSHGWHVGLVVARADLAGRDPSLAVSLPPGRWLEMGWGDARYYREADPGVGLALRAVLWPTASVLHVAGFEDRPERFFAGLEVVELAAAPDGYGALLDFVAGSLTRSPEGAPVPLGPGWYGASRFFEARGSFHAFNTCNTWAARAAARAGLPVTTRLTVTASGLMEQLRRASRPPASGGQPRGKRTIRNFLIAKSESAGLSGFRAGSRLAPSWP